MIYQVIPKVQNSYEALNEQSRFWVAGLFLLNCLWLPAFSYRLWWLSFLIISAMYICLVMIYCHLKINYGVSRLISSSGATSKREEVQWYVKTLVFVGFSTNMAWLSVATILNFLVACLHSGWYTDVNGVRIGGNPDFVIMVIVAVS